MPRRVFAVEAFEPDDLQVLVQVYNDVRRELGRSANPSDVDLVKDAIAIAIFDMARAGQRDPERLWCYAMSQGRLAAACNPFDARAVHPKYSPL